mmetsp:Transcript_21304/g.46228  ORF Transcript_21304/g.46228 Transcript_21304/m.46228 type:complete len:596 (+) Transcript_21304:182-1969(+)
MKQVQTKNKKSHGRKGVDEAPTNEPQRPQPSFLTSEKFEDRPDLHPATKKALKNVLKVDTLSEIQLKSYDIIASGKDCLGRARTGTGKTLAYLVPALTQLLENPPKKNSVGIVVISPTRELASQIADQAEKLLTFHPDLSAQVVYGGTKVSRDVARFKQQIPTILVATPGRMLDHLTSTEIRGRSFGKDIIPHTPLVVLDETDTLLDMGSRRDIERILSYMPPRDRRQTLLFSATLPPDLKAIMEENMKSDFVKVDCIHDATEDTSSKITESHVIIPTMDRFVSSVAEIVHFAMQEDAEAKMICFFPTARVVAFFAELFNEHLNIPVIELHSRKSQSYRDKASDTFRTASSAILFTSDVSARGVDYPGVSQVIQFGLPDSREQYIHRLGRTGRAGKEGKGWLVLASFEAQFLHQLKGLTVPENKSLNTLMNNPIDSEIHDLMESATGQIRSSKKRQKTPSGAYQAFLGFYLGKMKVMKMRSKEELVNIANKFSAQMGLPDVPSLTKRMVGKMGLKGVGGITIGEEDFNDRGQGQGSGPRQGAGSRQAPSSRQGSGSGRGAGSRQGPSPGSGAGSKQGQGSGRGAVSSRKRMKRSP